MNLKIVLTLVVIGAIALASVMIVVSRNKTTPDSKPTISDTQMDVEISTAPDLKDYIDPAGFSFSYPAKLGISSEELAPTSYAKITLIVPETGISIKINVDDSKEKTLEAILKKRGVTSEIKKTALADLDAIQYKSATQTATLALDEGVLFEITLNKPDKGDAFDSMYDDLIGSFAFEKPGPSTPQQQAQPDNSSSEDVVFEGEEVVE